MPVARCVWVTGVLVAYRWIVEQTVAAVNTLTHAILGLPAVERRAAAAGSSILFGGALLIGAGGVFGALLVIVGVLFAAGAVRGAGAGDVGAGAVDRRGAAADRALGDPGARRISRARGRRALLAVALVPVGWTVLFATAGALVLDATSFTGGADGLPGHVAAAFAALITFVLAVRLPWTLLGSLKRLVIPSLSGPAAAGARLRQLPAAARATAAFARLRSTGVHGTLSLGRSAGAAAGALGAPAGGLVGLAARRFHRNPRPAASPPDRLDGRLPGGSSRPARRSGRLADAAAIIRGAPDRAREAGGSASSPAGRPAPTAGSSRPHEGEPETPRSAKAEHLAASPAERWSSRANPAGEHRRHERRSGAAAGSRSLRRSARWRSAAKPRPNRQASDPKRSGRHRPNRGARRRLGARARSAQSRLVSRRETPHAGRPPRRAAGTPVRPPRPRKPDRRPRKKKGPR